MELLYKAHNNRELEHIYTYKTTFLCFETKIGQGRFTLETKTKHMNLLSVPPLFLDLSGLAFGLSSVAQVVVGVLTAFVSGIVAAATRERSGERIFHRALSWLYGAIFPSVLGAIGWLYLGMDFANRSQRKALDKVSLLFLILGLLGMIIFAISRNKSYGEKKEFLGDREGLNDEIIDDL